MNQADSLAQQAAQALASLRASFDTVARWLNAAW